MENHRTYRVGLLVERSRAFGRELCEGVITFAQEREDWELHFMDAADIPRRSPAQNIDGFIARVTTDAIAASLNMSVNTLRHHITSIYKKTGVQTRSALCKLAVTGDR